MYILSYRTSLPPVSLRRFPLASSSRPLSTICIVIYLNPAIDLGLE